MYRLDDPLPVFDWDAADEDGQTESAIMGEGDPQKVFAADLLPALRSLCCLMREPWRMEQCSRGRVFRNARPAWSRDASDLRTNVECGIDWPKVEFQLPGEYRWAVECIARTTMPGMYDSAHRLAATWDYVATVCQTQIDWGIPSNRQWQHDTWIAEVERLAATLPRYVRELECIRAVMRLICFAKEVAGQDLCFPQLAGEVSARCRCWVRLLRGEEPEPLFP